MGKKRNEEKEEEVKEKKRRKRIQPNLIEEEECWINWTHLSGGAE